MTMQRTRHAKIEFRGRGAHCIRKKWQRKLKQL